MTLRRNRNNRPDDQAAATAVGGPARRAGTHSAGRSRVRYVAGGIAIVLVGGGIALAGTAASASNGSGHGHGPGIGPSGRSDHELVVAHTGSAGSKPRSATSKPAPKPLTSTTATSTPAPRPTHPVIKLTPRLVGTVKSSSAGQILIVDSQGFTRTIKVSATTTYRDSLTATPAVGTRIVAFGSVDADGTSLDATVVAKFANRWFAHHHGPEGDRGGQDETSTPSAAPTS